MGSAIAWAAQFTDLPTGAQDGQCLIYDAAFDRFVWGTPETSLPVPLISGVQGNRIGGSTQSPGGMFGLEVPAQFPNPNSSIQQAFSAFAFFTGTPGGSSGPLQGGSSESSVFNNGSGDITVPAVGFEAIARIDGTNADKIVTAIALQATTTINGSQGATNLVGINIPAPMRAGGSGTVTNAISLLVAEPTVGMNTWAAHLTGRTRLTKGSAANAFEVANGSDLLQWGSDGTKLTGYGSDGAITYLILDPEDAPSTARVLTYLPSTGSHFVAQTPAGFVFQVAANGSFGCFGATPPAAQSPAGTTAADAIACLKAFGLMHA